MISGIHGLERSILAVALFALVAGRSGAEDVESIPVCDSVSTTYRIVQREGNKFLLGIEIDNKTSSAFEIYKFKFDPALMRLDAEESAGGMKLEQAIPLIGYGIENVYLQPGEKYEHEIDLNMTFPKLLESLRRNGVYVSFELKVEPLSSCYSGTVRGRMLIGKRD